MQEISRVDTLPLFPDLHAELIGLLSGLPMADWQKPTVCRGWSVQDVAAHILDTQLRIVSSGRDHHAGPVPAEPIRSYGELVDFLNALNGQWVEPMRRVSPPQLLRMLEESGPAMAAQLAMRDPDAPARFSVAWAGETVSANWFEIGRQYTEYWHHHQQIRDAVGAAPLNGRRWLYPVLALFLRALPYSYRDVASPSGVVMEVVIEGDAGGVWTLVRRENGWALGEGQGTGKAAARVELTDDSAWRLFTNGLSSDEALRVVKIMGDRTLGEPFLRVRSVMV